MYLPSADVFSIIFIVSGWIVSQLDIVYQKWQKNWLFIVLHKEQKKNSNLQDRVADSKIDIWIFKQITINWNEHTKKTEIFELVLLLLCIFLKPLTYSWYLCTNDTRYVDAGRNIYELNACATSIHAISIIWLARSDFRVHFTKHDDDNDGDEFWMHSHKHANNDSTRNPRRKSFLSLAYICTFPHLVL